MDKKGIYLIVGLVVTALYIALSAGIYDGLFYDNEFSPEMRDNSVYLYVSLTTAAITWGMAAIYYYVINSVKFDRWYHWLVVLGVVAVATPVVCYGINDAVFAASDLEYGNQMVSFELVNMVVVAIMFVVASFSMRWWSSNCRHTPIPQ